MKREHSVIKAEVERFIAQLEREATAPGRYQEIRRSHASRLRVVLDDAVDRVEAIERTEHKYAPFKPYGQVLAEAYFQQYQADNPDWDTFTPPAKFRWETIAQALIKVYEEEVFG